MAVRMKYRHIKNVGLNPYLLSEVFDYLGTTNRVKPTSGRERLRFTLVVLCEIVEVSESKNKS